MWPGHFLLSTFEPLIKKKRETELHFYVTCFDSLIFHTAVAHVSLNIISSLRQLFYSFPGSPAASVLVSEIKISANITTSERTTKMSYKKLHGRPVHTYDRD